ncbi:MAG: hypothetical protein ACRDRA_03015 [Pseudonocardiaceae bacterium]
MVDAERFVTLIVPVGFKHIVAAWRQNTIVPTLGLEPNGALTFSSDNQGYFERDSLAALSTLLTHLPTLQALDDTLDRLAALLSTWETTTRDKVVLFDGGTHKYLAVRASGTEPGTRLYIEAPPLITNRIIGLFNTSE